MWRLGFAVETPIWRLIRENDPGRFAHFGPPQLVGITAAAAGGPTHDHESHFNRFGDGPLSSPTRCVHLFGDRLQLKPAGAAVAGMIVEDPQEVLHVCVAGLEFSQHNPPLVKREGLLEWV